MAAKKRAKTSSNTARTKSTTEPFSRRAGRAMTLMRLEPREQGAFADAVGGARSIDEIPAKWRKRILDVEKAGGKR